MKYGVNSSASLDVDDPEHLLREYLTRTLDKIVHDSKDEGDSLAGIPPAALMQQLGRENEALKAQLKALEEVDDAEINRLYDRIEALEGSKHSLEAAQAKPQQEALENIDKEQSPAQRQPSDAGALVVAHGAPSRALADEQYDKLLQVVTSLETAVSGRQVQEQLDKVARENAAKLAAMEERLQEMAAAFSREQLGLQQVQLQQLGFLERLVSMREAGEGVAVDGGLTTEPTSAKEGTVGHQSTAKQQGAPQQLVQQPNVQATAGEGAAQRPAGQPKQQLAVQAMEGEGAVQRLAEQPKQQPTVQATDGAEPAQQAANKSARHRSGHTPMEPRSIMPGHWDCDLCQVKFDDEIELFCHFASKDHKNFVNELRDFYRGRGPTNAWSVRKMDEPSQNARLRCQLCARSEQRIRQLLDHQSGKIHGQKLITHVPKRMFESFKRKRQDT